MISERDAINVSRQVLFITIIDDCNYFSCSGTAFLVYLKGHLFAVTAKHVLTKHEYSPNSFRLRYQDQSRELLEFDEMFFLTTPLVDDTDHIDILFFKVSEKLFKYNVNSGVIINFNNFEEVEPSGTDILLVTGFPDVVSNINYEDKIFNHFRQPFEGKEVTHSGLNDIYKFKYSAENNGVKFKLSGMSGSPVFLYKESGICKGIAGILLRHSYFLSAKNIHTYLHRIIENLPNQKFRTDSLKLVG